MDILIRVGQLFLSLAILVALHEIGHFAPAKLFKTRVEKFYLFFNPWFSIFKKKIGETEYGLGWLPLGGYVKIAGMIDESMDKEQLKKDPEPWEFRSKPAWQRLIIMIGGVVVNVILGFLIYSLVVFTWGENQIRPQDLSDEGLGFHPVMEKYGFQGGDKILSVNGKPFENINEITQYLLFRDVKTITVKRKNGESKTLPIPEDIGKEMFKEGVIRGSISPRMSNEISYIEEGFPADSSGIKVGDKILGMNGKKIEYFDQILGKIKPGNNTFIIEHNQNIDTINVIPNENLKIGISCKKFEYNIHLKEFTFTQSIKKGIGNCYWTLHDYAKQFSKYVFTKKGAKQVGGFASIAKMFPTVWHWPSFWERTALLSIILAFMNILPIPALDGGHVMFLVYEMVTGRKPGEKFLEIAQYIGMGLLLSLMLYANFNDLLKWIMGNF